MSSVQRAQRTRAGGQRADGRALAPAAGTREASQPSVPAPAWLGPVTAGAPFTLAGVQRKVTIGAPDDAYEREAEQVAGRVVSGQTVAPHQITPIGPGAGQRAPAEERKDEKPPATSVQKAAAPDEKKKEPPAVQKAAAADEKKKEPAKAAAVQKAAAPDEKKKEPVQKAAAPDEKKKQPAKAAAVQKAAARDEKKKESAKAAAVQKAASPEEKKKQPVQKAAAPDEKKKEPAKATAVQKAASPDEKKKEPAKATAVQKAASPDEKKKQPVQKAAAPDEKKKKNAVQKAAAPDEKKKQAVQKAAAPDDKKKEPAKAAAVQKAASPDEKKKQPVQKAAAPDEKKKDAVQKAAAPDEKKQESVQKAAAPDEKKKEPASVQKAGGGGVTPAMESAAGHAVQTKGAGEPLHAPTRDTLESRLGADLSGVRVHQDAAARGAAEAIDARAFTHGRDVWLGPGESQNDMGLMAHEATHVVQQAGGAHRLPLQRAPKAAPAASTPPTSGPADASAAGADVAAEEWDFESPKGKIKKDQKISIPLLKVPDFKKPFTPSPLALPPKEDVPERTDQQREIWDKAAGAGTTIEEKLEAKCAAAKGPAVQKGGQPVYFLELPKQNFYVIGTKKEIKERVLRPFWNKQGDRNAFQVDHKQEVQLTEAGKDPDRLENFWLLDAKANMDSGRNIKEERNERLDALLELATKPQKEKKGKKGKKEEAAKAAKPEEGESGKTEKPSKAQPIFDKPQDAKQVRNKYQITFEKVQGGLEPKGKPETWTLEEIRDKVKQLDALKVLNEAQVKKAGLQGSPKDIAIYTSETGGTRRVVHDWPEGGNSKKSKFSYGKRAFQVDEVEYDAASKTGSLHGTAYKGSKLISEATFDLPIRPMDAVLYGGYIPSSDIPKKFKALGIKGLSPIEMDFVELTDKGFVGRGRVLPDVPVIKDMAIDLVLDGDDIYLSKVLSADAFKFPGPIQVTAASLEIYAGTNGVGARGSVFFEVERVGRGKLFAKGGTEGGFAIGGDFAFDSELFDPADIHVEYAYRDGKGTFSGSGEIGIKEGKVKGIKSASLKVSFVDEKIDATGTVKPDIPAVEQGDMEFHYAPDTGIVISGSLTLKKDTPGIESGSVSAALAKRPGDDHWRVKATGEAVPKIPGVSAKLTVSYDDGLFDIVGTAGYEKGMLKGSITVGVTNRPVSPEGAPGGEPADKADKVTLYGGGSLTLRLAPWLAATATVRLLPNGEIEVTGEIGLPSAIELFKGKEFKKNIFKIGIDIPIIGFSVAGQHVGVFFSIGGGLDLEAGIGPGELQKLSLSVTYNPAHEDQTHVSGGAALHIPAHAGLRLFISGALGAGIPLVDAKAGIEVGGMLGIEGALDAAVQVDWTPTKGLDIQAMAEVYAEPKFRFDITGFVLVELDLLIDTIELYSHRWQLAAFEYGSGLRLGLKLPIHYVEGQPFDVSLSDIQFEVPNIDPMELLEGLIHKIV